MRNQRFVCSGVLALVLPVTLGLACVERDWSICSPKDQCKPGFTCTDDFRCVRASDGGSDSVLSVDSHGPTDAAGGSVDLAVSAGTDGPGSVGPDAAGPPMDAPPDAAVSTVPDAPDAAGPPDAPPVGGPPDAPVGGLPDVPAVDAPPIGPTVDAAGSCSTDKDCSPQKPLCLGNQCTTCSSDNDCTGRTGTPACATSGLCVACTANKHCTGAAGTCDTATNQCVGCVKRSDCGGVCQTCSSGSVCTALKNQDDPGLCAGTCDSTGACKSKQGQTCQTAGGGCAAGTTCSPDGVCCDQACANSCMACDISGFLGICTPVASGAPHGNRASCGTDATCGGACAGKPDGTCSYPTKSCGAGPSCAGSDRITAQATCLGGTCQTPATTTCQGGFACATGACNSTCVTSADCQADYFCYNQKCHSDVVSVAAGGYQTCVALKDGRVMCWGLFALGDGLAHATPVGTPVQVASMTSAKMVRSSGTSVCALTSLGNVACWGVGDYGQLGSGTNTPASGQTSYFSNVPVTVLTTGGSPLTGIFSLYGGYNSFCAVGSTATYCWGDNSGGQLGFATPTNPEYVLSATQIQGAPALSPFAMGYGFQIGIANSSTVNAWGQDVQGTIDPSQSNAIYPSWSAKSFTTTTNISQVVAGVRQACLLYVTGEVQCWGGNIFGQLGNGTTSTDPTPGHKIPAFTASRLTSGAEFMCAQTSDSSNVVCWGLNSDGVINPDISSNFSVPTRVSLNLPAGPAVTEVVASTTSGHVCTILSEGSLMCWGRNSSLQTGTGATSSTVTVPSFVQANW